MNGHQEKCDDVM